MSSGSCRSAGLTMRHGPHHGAQRSISAGTDARSATSAKSSSLASTIHGSGLWQLPQRGVPVAAAGTPFPRPQFGQGTRSAAMSGHLAWFAVLGRHGGLAVGQPDADDGAITDIARHERAPAPGLPPPG